MNLCRHGHDKDIVGVSGNDKTCKECVEISRKKWILRNPQHYNKIRRAVTKRYRARYKTTERGRLYDQKKNLAAFLGIRISQLPDELFELYRTYRTLRKELQNGTKND